jgi:hypothetical protein
MSRVRIEFGASAAGAMTREKLPVFVLPNEKCNSISQEMSQHVAGEIPANKVEGS